MPYIAIFFSWITAGVGLGLTLRAWHTRWETKPALALAPVLVCVSHEECAQNSEGGL